MKFLKDYTQAELAVITDAEAAHLVELEIAQKGIPVAIRPTEKQIITETITPEIIGYEVGGLIFVNEADAIAVTTMPIYHETYDGDYYNRFLEQQTEPEKLQRVAKYSRAQAFEHRATIRDRKNRAEDTKKDGEAWGNYCKAVQDVKDQVWSAIYDAQRTVNKIQQAKTEFERFVVLAEGNQEIAKRFFTNAFCGKDDLIEAVLGAGWDKEAAEAKA
jgi:hypothetical protein